MAVNLLIASRLAVSFGCGCVASIEGVGYFENGIFGANQVDESNQPASSRSTDRELNFDATGALVMIVRAVDIMIERYAADSNGIALIDRQTISINFSGRQLLNSLVRK